MAISSLNGNCFDFCCVLRVVKSSSLVYPLVKFTPDVWKPECPNMEEGEVCVLVTSTFVTPNTIMVITLRLFFCTVQARVPKHVFAVIRSVLKLLKTCEYSDFFCESLLEV